MSGIIFVNVMVLVSKLCLCEPMQPNTVCDYIGSGNDKKHYVVLLQDNYNGLYTPTNGYVRLTCEQKDEKKCNAGCEARWGCKCEGCCK